MFNKFFGQFSKDIGIDLGTANTLVYVKDKGIVINEPSVVAINTRTEEILAVGDDAKKMVGKTPAHIIAVKPLQDGVISDFEISEKMLNYFIQKTHKETRGFVPRPRVVIGLPMEVTEVERKAVEDATLSAGAREVYLIEEPLAAAIGSRIPIHEPSGFMIADIGGGTTEIAVMSLGGIVTKKSLRVAGNELTEAILNYVREQFNMLIGERTAEEAKIKIGNVANNNGDIIEYRLRGRNLLDGLPAQTSISNEQIQHAIMPSINIIVESIIATIEETPPELVADIQQRGIMLAGGGALLQGLNTLIAERTHVPVNVVDDPLTAVVRGAGILLEDIELLKQVRLPSV